MGPVRLRSHLLNIQSSGQVYLSRRTLPKHMLGVRNYVLPLGDNFFSVPQKKRTSTVFGASSSSADGDRELRRLLPRDLAVLVAEGGLRGVSATAEASTLMAGCCMDKNTN